MQAFCKFLFDIEINLNDLDILYQASIEWRKEISMKGKGNMDIKVNAINIILSYIKNNTIGAPEQQEYLVNNAIKAAEYLQEDYATGLDRNLKIGEINRRLANIKKIISLIKNGEVATIIGSKIKDQVKDIVDSHPALSRKGPAPEADDF